ncbi:hypothetical protein [Salinimonas chungwhensis]|uniref:hypothetical protein n=1 Tax=Salinimonas chungwhensis TaxID=265425 RepID=UPI00037F2641|nr:hypothetical protein [Salinimonas chungwhensis]
MVWNKPVQFLLVAAFATFLVACDKTADNGDGDVSAGTPEYAAIVFARAIYHDDNIDKALAVSTDSMRRILSSYHTNRNAQRHIMNLNYEQVNIKPDGGNRIGRTEFAEKASVTLFFNGNYNGNTIKELRTIHLLRQGGQWKVDRVSEQYG